MAKVDRAVNDAADMVVRGDTHWVDKWENAQHDLDSRIHMSILDRKLPGDKLPSGRSGSLAAGADSNQIPSSRLEVHHMETRWPGGPQPGNRMVRERDRSCLARTALVACRA